jgi:hypothetical protein
VFAFDFVIPSAARNLHFSLHPVNPLLNAEC